MELGGKNGQIVFPDGDLEAAADAAVFGGFFNAGECCNAGSRLIVHKDIANDFLAAVKQLTAKVRVGDPLDDSTKVGAMISTDHLAKVSSYVSAAKGEGGTVLAGGDARASNAGQYLDPTIVTGVTENMSIAREEVFGPVLSVLTFKTIEKALHIANDTPYGLSAGVWTQGHRHLHDGGARRPYRNGVGQHLHGRLSRTAVRRIQAVRPWTRAWEARGGGLYRGKDDPVSSRPAHRLVGRLSWEEPGGHPPVV